MPKEVKFSDDARASIFKWIEKVFNAVSITMGPKGRNVIFEREYWMPQVTNDGATIAKELDFEDKYENMWAELVKEAASTTNDLAWDGTTTATVLTYALAKEGLRSIRTWVNAVEIKNGMRKAWELVIEELEKQAKTISSKEEITQVASVSAQDYEVGRIIADAMEKVGNDWVITVEEWQTFGLWVEVMEGMEFDSGYVSPYMVTNPEKMISEMPDAPILVTDEKISSMKALLPLLENLVQNWKKDIVLIADEIEWEALTTIVLNRMKWILNVLAVKAPWFGDRKKEYLGDIAISTGATLITKDLWFNLESVSMDHLWHAEKVISHPNKTTIIGWKWDKHLIQSRVEEIKNQFTLTDSNFEKEKHAERIAKLSGWVAVIKVWAVSEVEMREKKLRIEDALNATRAAVEEGIVAWGWVALLKASKILENIDFAVEDQNIWANIVQLALSYPVKQITQNAWREPSVIANEVLANDDYYFGYDAWDDRYKDMLEAWIIDPKKVERIALEEAISLAGMFLTTESAIVSTAKDESPIIPNSMGQMPPMM